LATPFRKSVLKDNAKSRQRFNAKPQSREACGSRGDEAQTAKSEIKNQQSEIDQSVLTLAATILLLLQI
jgi:hypothetical protein